MYRRGRIKDTCGDLDALYSDQPMTLALRYDVFDDDRYLYEPKWDGWRILIHKQSDRIEAYTRNGRIVTTKFPELGAAREAIRADTAILFVTWCIACMWEWMSDHVRPVWTSATRTNNKAHAGRDRRAAHRNDRGAAGNPAGAADHGAAKNSADGTSNTRAVDTTRVIHKSHESAPGMGSWDFV